MKVKMKSHIKIGDKVKVISGKQKGFVGVITALETKKSILFLDGIIPRLKFKKPRQGGDAQRIEIQVPIHISNVMLWDIDSNSASRIGYKLFENKKVRYFKKSGNILFNKTN